MAHGETYRFEFVDGTAELVRHGSPRYWELIGDGHTPVGSVPESDGVSDALDAYLSQRFGEGQATTDAATAALVSDPGTQTGAALSATFGKVYNIAAYGATPSAASAAIQAAHDAMPTKGGTILIPVGDWECASTVTITKPCRVVGQGGSYEFGSTRLRFAEGVKGFDVDLPDSGDRFTMEDVALLSYSTVSSTTGHGFHARKGRVTLTNVSAFQFGGHGFYFDSRTAGDNVNHSLCTMVRAYGNRGDGIRLEGTDSNALTFVNPDVVANYGYGINNMCGHNLFLHPHGDQQFNGSPGAFRDNGLSNRWEWVYEESGQEFLIDAGSSVGYLSFSTFGAPTIATSGAAHTVWEIVRSQGARNRLRTSNGVKQWQAGVGLIGANTFDITNETDGANLMSASADGSEVNWYASHYPVGDRDLGWAGAKWRDAHLGRWLRLADQDGTGELFLRNNNGVLEKSLDGSAWSAV